MGYQAIAVCVTIGLTLISTVAYMLFEQRRYLTNNRNAIDDGFQIYRIANCPICLERLDGGPESVIINCGHELHQQCLTSMDNHRGIFATNTCPICRTPIRL